MTDEEFRAAWTALVLGGGLDPRLACRAYNLAHRIGRGAGRAEALRTVRDTGSVVAARDALIMLNEVEAMFLDVREAEG